MTKPWYFSLAVSLLRREKMALIVAFLSAVLGLVTINVSLSVSKGSRLIEETAFEESLLGASFSLSAIRAIEREDYDLIAHERPSIEEAERLFGKAGSFAIDYDYALFFPPSFEVLVGAEKLKKADVRLVDERLLENLGLPLDRAIPNLEFLEENPKAQEGLSVAFSYESEFIREGEKTAFSYGFSLLLDKGRYEFPFLKSPRLYVPRGFVTREIGNVSVFHENLASFLASLPQNDPYGNYALKVYPLNGETLSELEERVKGLPDTFKVESELLSLKEAFRSFSSTSFLVSSAMTSLQLVAIVGIFLLLGDSLYRHVRHDLAVLRCLGAQRTHVFLITLAFPFVNAALSSVFALALSKLAIPLLSAWSFNRLGLPSLFASLGSNLVFSFFLMFCAAFLLGGLGMAIPLLARSRSLSAEAREE